MWLGLFLLWLLSHLSFRVQWLLSLVFGFCLYYLLPSRRNIAKINIGLCFASKTKDQKQQLLKSHFYALGVNIIAIANGFYLSQARTKKICHIKGRQYLEQAIAKKQPIMLLAGHWTSMMLVGGCIKSEYGQVADIFRPQNNQLFSQAMQKSFAKKNIKMLHFKQLKSIVTTLKDNTPTWYAHDQDLGDKKSIFAPFFGIQTATIIGTAKLAKLTNAQVLPVMFYTQDNHYILEISPPLKNYPSGDELADATKTNAILEAQIRQKPEQYYWVHKRFKTRLNNEPYMY